MNNEFTVMVSSKEATEELGEKLGKALSGGEVIELVSDLGGGKTTFTRGIARGIGSTDIVSSPTFTISNVYKGPKLEMHHYDFYRIGELGLMNDELIETMADAKVVVVMEWADKARSIMPESRTIHVYIEPIAENENARCLRLAFGDALTALKGRLA